ncbi:pyridoxal phosphate-dependent decarboxylase family protein [Vibrio marisflavi]|uniref:L-2,4-diaminobutyrate decarboxylase n=1 Tax=Vibrio marisflavi CECT 7928 TaxID=634439 RepID=A0ABN8E7B7_9VIBR|nr:aspartate aminotransferase family protein [Vibrio marisflavi]CAH0541714.1 L-2,4-diaminobutyrate decarboxylase [Vibrio marisflavi CECT 7928]
MISADSLNAVQSGNQTQPEPSDFIFNQENLQAYEASLLQGLNLVKSRIEKTEKPFSGVLPKELASQFAQLDLELPLNSISDALQEVESLYLKDAIYFHHPKYMAHLNCPIVYPAILAEQILSSINSSLDTWDQSAGGTLIEQKLLDWTLGRIGYDRNADGIFTSGGTQSNLMAMLLARDSYCAKHGNHNVREQGLPHYGHKFRIFTSEISHFSIQKSAALLGLGYNAVVPVAVDEQFRMDIQALKSEISKTIEQGCIPLAVVATTGTTDFGSIDPVHPIAQLCQQHDIWMHVDAAYGCGTLVSAQNRHLLAGIEQADSVTVDYHKSFFQPVSCGAFFSKDKSKLSLITHHAEYLNPLSQKQEGTPNLVDKSLQTTRRFDSLKLWLTLRIMGADKIGAIFDQVIDLAKQSHQRYQADKHIELLHQPELSTLVFRFIPLHPTTNEETDKANEFIRKAIFRSGEAVIASTQVKGKRYLKFTLLNPATQIDHVSEVIELIKQLGQQYFSSIHQQHQEEHFQSNAVCMESL